MVPFKPFLQTEGIDIVCFVTSVQFLENIDADSRSLTYYEQPLINCRWWWMTGTPRGTPELRDEINLPPRSLFSEQYFCSVSAGGTFSRLIVRVIPQENTGGNSLPGKRVLQVWCRLGVNRPRVGSSIKHRVSFSLRESESARLHCICVMMCHRLRGRHTRDFPCEALWTGWIWMMSSGCYSGLWFLFKWRVQWETCTGCQYYSTAVLLPDSDASWPTLHWKFSNNWKLTRSFWGGRWVLQHESSQIHIYALVFYTYIFINIL